MSDITVEVTFKGATKATKRRYTNVTEHAMNTWDDAVEDAVGGDKLRLIDNVTGRIMSEYNPVERSAT
jgi:hypothetical protein